MMEVPLKHVAHVNCHSLAQSTDPEFRFLYCDVSSVENGNLTLPESEIAFADAPSRARRVAQEQAIVMSTVRPYLKAVAQVPQCANDVVFSTGFAVLTPKQEAVTSRFLYWALQSDLFVAEAARWSNGVSYPAISADDLMRITLPIPVLGMQERLARYLDVETAKIDHLITKQQELITLLQERMSAFAEDVLVKGLVLEGDASMEQRRVKHLFKLRDKRNHRERQEVTLLSLYTQYGVRKYDEIEERTGNPVRTVEDYKCVRQGDIIVNIILAWMGSIGRSPYDGVISPAYDIWKPVEGISSHYYHYLFRTKWFSGECYKRGKGIMMMRWRTYADQFGDISVPFPSRQEQEHVVNLIEQEQARVEILIMKARRMIALLQERRSALITAAVTGQVEV
ncbi:restriction endonuclease subunit S [Corynebacterium diphtheriae bv. gravis]|uniref:restriction endonuclease subunit S n=1 Tax=Corynebacterium diphtheriae TaxID=1717 RepID=UPI0018CB0644|nr:restriction endonuclease subunit S [Corynebacterium diphtheriae]MBG9296982.1 restriction endonuclease subunit S [Corynebacterium diphtheriae bv. gravis]